MSQFVFTKTHGTFDFKGQATACPSWYVKGTCNCGANYFKEINCGREWCPVCGSDNSAVHMRRISRWLPKLQQLNTAGYWVFTIPEELRQYYRSSKSLTYLQKCITSGDKRKGRPGILEQIGIKRGLSRWHFFGESCVYSEGKKCLCLPGQCGNKRKESCPLFENDGKYHPHLNVICDSTKLKKEDIELVKKLWAQTLHTEKAVVNYSYRPNQAAMYHTLKYVTRSTFLNYEWSGFLAAQIKNFRNNKSWGNWTGETKWKLKTKKTTGIVSAEKLNRSECPICGDKIHWNKKKINLADLDSHPGTFEVVANGFYLYR